MKGQRRVLRWWPAALVVVLVGAGAGWWFLFRKAGGAQAADLSQIYTAARGSLVASISPTGEVYAPRKAELGFDVTRLPITEVSVAAGQEVKKGSVLARIDPSTLERAVTQAEADLVTAQEALDTAQNPYTELELVRARLTVSQSQASLVEAQAALDDLLNPDIETAQGAVRDAAAALKSARDALVVAQNQTDTTSKLRTLEYEATWYEHNWWDAQAKFEAGKIDKDKLNLEYSNMLAAKERLKVAQVQAESTLTNAQNSVAKAQDNYNDAVESLSRLKAGPDAADLAKAKNQVAQAGYDLAKAQADLAEMEAGPSQKDIDVAKAKAASAQAALDEAKAIHAAATMVAPFDGTVISVGAEVGDLVSSGATVVTLADLSYLRISAAVNETDISPVQVGQDATITFDALSGQRFRGKVLEIPLEGQLSQNILTYDVVISLEGGDISALKPGMTANLNIVVGKAENALLVPVLAVKQSETGSVVSVRDTPNGAPTEVPVITGLSDGTYIEVRQGLNEGDQVVVEYQAPTATTGQQGVFRAEPIMIGGGVPRGGR